MTDSIHLQGIGRVPAIPARDLRPGMLLSWNYSWRAYKVESVKDASPMFMEVVETNVQTGRQSKRRLKKNRLVAAHQA